MQNFIIGFIRGIAPTIPLWAGFFMYFVSNARESD
ncbi:hypothetical protein QE429_000824 [Bacillus sp. SORGH_AS 510]|nr:hypothetical protein [Bacillus sp. SORGH_AS_0510]